jgi:GNAT superfamily N-acetyltransferase
MQFVSSSPSLAQQLEPLFDQDDPIPIRLWAVLDGTIQGRILVNHPDAPSVALVQELAEGTTYIGGKPTTLDLAVGVTQLRQHQEVVICLWASDPRKIILPATPDYEGVAIDFINRAVSVGLNKLTTPPAGHRLQQINAEIVPLLSGFDYYEVMFGSVAQALQNTIGYCLFYGGEVVSEAVAGPLTRGIAEIGVGTVEHHRKKGLATVVAARVIQECEAQGYRPFWNASYQNVPSVALAQRLGFKTERPFDVFAWSATQ